MEAVHADWKEYLNLLICEENHLKQMDEYHKVRHRGQIKITHTLTFKQVKLVSVCMLICVCVQFYKEARDTQDLLKRLDTEVNQKYNPEFKDVYQIEVLIRELDVSFFYLNYMNDSVTPFTPVENTLSCFCVSLGPSQGHGQL